MVVEHMHEFITVVAYCPTLHYMCVHNAV